MTYDPSVSTDGGSDARDGSEVLFEQVAREARLSDKVADMMLETILSRKLSVGDRLPSERELCEEFDVSRAVVRPALEILERQGRIVRVQGKGTFVAPPKRPLPIRGLVSLFARTIPDDMEVHVGDAHPGEVAK